MTEYSEEMQHEINKLDKLSKALLSDIADDAFTTEKIYNHFKMNGKEISLETCDMTSEMCRVAFLAGVSFAVFKLIPDK